eukprot:COSAG02_NODE_179_length_31090_cov_49.813785_27_plen_48_part_00
MSPCGVRTQPPRAKYACIVRRCRCMQHSMRLSECNKMSHSGSLFELD